MISLKTLSQTLFQKLILYFPSFFSFSPIYLLPEFSWAVRPLKMPRLRLSQDFSAIYVIEIIILMCRHRWFKKIRWTRCWFDSSRIRRDEKIYLDLIKWISWKSRLSDGEILDLVFFQWKFHLRNKWHFPIKKTSMNLVFKK